MRGTATATLEATFSEAFASLPRGVGVLGRYVMLEMVGQGGMGVVWKAYDPVLDRKIALKLLVAPTGAPGNVVTEAQAMARVQHPNVVVVYDAGVHESGGHQLAYVAMELVTGGTLKDWLEDPAHALEDKIDMFVRAGRGLEAAHRAGLVHRDFKPSNVLIGEDGRVQVSDFGLSVIGASPAVATGSSPVVVGTPRYMSPGQLHGMPADVRSDQFAFCVALYDAVFGAPPFELKDGASPAELRESILRAPKPIIRSRLQARIAPIVLRGLAVEPADRWESMTALLAALDALRGPRTRRVVVGAILGAVVLTSAVFAWRYVTDPARACRDATDGLAALWRPDRRQALAASFGRLPGGADAWQRVDGALADWTSRWSTLRVEQCEADRNGERTSPILTARRECLDRRLGELDGLLRAMEAPDATVVTYASAAAHGLTLPEGCTSVAPPLEGRPPPPRGPGVAEAYGHLDRAAALNRLGKERPALDEAKIAAEAATQLDWAPLVADAELELATALFRVNETGPATDAYYRSLWAAEKARDDGRRLEAAMGLFFADSLASDYPGAGRWVESAKAIAQHMPADPVRQARLAFLEMELALREERMKDCLRIGEDGLRLAETIGAESPILVKMLITLSQCSRSLEDLEDVAMAHLQRALPITEKINGHDHKTTAMVLSELGVLARRARRYDAALAYYRDALAIRERLVGPDNPDCAGLHNNIANVFRDQQRYDEARAELERALDIWTKAWGPDSPAVSAALHNLGKVFMLEGRAAEAEPRFRRSLEITRSKRPAGHPDIAEDAGTLGRCLLAQHEPDALPLLEESLAALEQDEDTGKAETADARFWVARARVELGVRTEGALGMAAAACAELDDDSEAADEAAACRAWLDARRR